MGTVPSPRSGPDRTTSEVAGSGTGGADTDEMAVETMLAFTRLARPVRHGDALPRHLRSLVECGRLAPRHVSALAVIAVAGPMAVSELAAREGLAVSTASLLVSQLAEVELVERHEDERDHRRTVVSVAPAHRAESRAVVESMLAPLRRALVRMGPRRAASLLEALEILAEESTEDGDGAAR